MAKNAIPFEKVLFTLKDLVKKVEEGYDISFARQFEGNETERSWAKADKAKYEWIDDKLWEIIYQLEDWVQI